MKLQLEIKVGRIPIEFLLLVLIILTPFYRTQIDPFYDAVVSVLVLPFVLVWICMGLRERQWELIRTPMNLPLVLFLLIGVLSTLVSVDVARSTHRYLAILNFSLVGFTLAHLFKKREDFMRIFRLLGVFTFFISVYAIPQYLYGFDPIPVLARSGQGTRAHSIFVWPTTFSAYLSLVMPVVLSFLFMDKQRWARIGWAAVFLTAFAAILASNSRSGWLTLAAALVVFAWFCGHQFLWQERRWIAVLAVGMVFVGFLFLTPTRYNTPAMLKRASETIDIRYAGNFLFNRWTLWKSAFAIMREHPHIGTGLGTFAFAYTQYKNPLYGTDMHNFPHNDYIQFAAEMGVVGGLALLWFVYGYGRTVLMLTPLRTQRFGLVTIGVIAGTVALLLHAFGDFDLNAPCMLLALGHFIGYTIVVGREEGLLPVRLIPLSSLRPFGGFSTQGLGVLLVGSYLLLTFVSVKPYIAAMAARHGSGLIQQGKLAEGMTLLEQAVAYQPREAPYHANLAAVYENLGVQRRDLTYMVKSEYQYLEATRLTPLDFSIVVELARFYFQYGQFLGEGKRYESLSLLKRAISLNPSQKVLHVYLGRNYAQLGLGREALHELATYLQENPGDQNVVKEYENIAASLRGS